MRRPLIIFSRLLVVVSLSFIAVALGGGAAGRPVQAYDGPPRAPNEQSVVQVARLRGARIGIVRIDGHLTINLVKFAATGSRWPASAAVLPGKHVLDVNMMVRAWQGNMAIWWVAEPGQSYLINGRSLGDKFSVWIVDARGRQVGGVVGSSDEPK